MKISNKLFYIPVFLLVGNLIFRLINQSKILKMFPLDTVNDWSSYIALLNFLDKCGFHNFCTYWYNGFTSFIITQPGWYFFTYPIYLISKSYTSASFTSMIIIFIASFIVIYKFGDAFKIDKRKRILFYLLLFANAASIGNYIRLGRVPEFFAFFLFVLFTFIILYYKDKKLDWRFIFIIPIYSWILISHQTFAILSSLIWISIFLIKDWKSRIYIIISIITSFIASSFWLIPYIFNFFNTVGIDKPIGINILSFDKEHLLETIFTFIIPLVFLFIFYLYIKRVKYDKREIIFYSPVLFISLLFLFRLTAFIPILNYIYPDVYMSFILFFILFLFFKNFKLNNNALVMIILLSIFSVLINIIYTPFFIEHTQLEKDTLEIMNDIKTNFLMTNTYSSTSYGKAYYSYAPIYLNISTPSGWEKIQSPYYRNLIINFTNGVYDKDCNLLYESARKLKDDYIISYNEDCNFLETCRYVNKVNKINNVCLYKFYYN